MKRGRKMPQFVYLFAKVLKKSEIQHSLNPLNEGAFKYALRHFSLQDEFWLHPRRCVRMVIMTHRYKKISVGYTTSTRKSP